MKILGIDPGLGRVGFGLLETVPDGNTSAGWAGRAFGPCQWGVIVTTKDKSDGARLQEIHDDLSELLTQFQPDVISLERLFYFRNNTTIIPVAGARGVILMLAHRFGVPVYEYTPMQVKQAITGSGKAEKAELQEALIHMLNLPKKPTPDDAADGLALAICYYNHAGRLHELQQSAGNI